MQFFRFDFNIDGIKADAKKVEAIVEMKFPIQGTEKFPWFYLVRNYAKTLTNLIRGKYWRVKTGSDWARWAGFSSL